MNVCMYVRTFVCIYVCISEMLYDHTYGKFEFLF